MAQVGVGNAEPIAVRAGPLGIGREQRRVDRIAALLDITERADWLSMKIFLQKKKWNFVRAVIAWYKKGIPTFTPCLRRHTWVADQAESARRLSTDSLRSTARRDDEAAVSWTEATGPQWATMSRQR